MVLQCIEENPTFLTEKINHYIKACNRNKTATFPIYENLKPQNLKNYIYIYEIIDHICEQQ